MEKRDVFQHALESATENHQRVVLKRAMGLAESRKTNPQGEKGLWTQIFPADPTIRRAISDVQGQFLLYSILDSRSVGEWPQKPEAQMLPEDQSAQNVPMQPELQNRLCELPGACFHEGF